eukprot:1179686-Prorocentrum_minimum.AAC.2
MPTSTSFILALPLKRNDSHFHNDAILSNRTPPNTAESRASRGRWPRPAAACARSPSPRRSRRS